MPSLIDTQRLKELNSYSIDKKYWFFKNFYNPMVSSRYHKYDKSKFVDILKIQWFTISDGKYSYDLTQKFPILELIKSPIYMVIKRDLNIINPQTYNEGVVDVYFIFKEDYEKDPVRYLEFEEGSY